MPRIYVSPLGTRNYQNYTEATLQAALDKIRSRKLSLRQTASEYNIPKSTLSNKLRGKHEMKPGGQVSLSSALEQVLVDHLITVAKYGFPVNNFDLRCIVKNYLDKNGKSVQKFKNNFPGYDWITCFLNRHKELSVRIAANVKKCRAKISPQILTEYFENLEETVRDVPYENIWNYDETNLTDDPLAKKFICKRGCKYPERIMNTSKVSISVMFCGSAAGELLPPYVVYKSKHLWDSWMERGPTGTRYNRSDSGWFDMNSFEDWFEYLCLPHLKKSPGKKVLVGDNLSSHLSHRAIQLCLQNDISFVCLPPNSSHLTQPLDVAFFRPLKIQWRKILEAYKAATGDGVVEKSMFPRLLKKLVDNVMVTGNISLMSGFKKCGIAPCEKDCVLKRLPQNLTTDDDSIDLNSSVSDTFLQYLSTERYGNADDLRKNLGRKKKVTVPPGKSMTEEDLKIMIKENSTSKKRKTTTTTEKRRKNYENLSDSESESNVDEPEEILSDTELFDEDPCLPYKVGDYVIVEYEGEHFPGLVQNVDVDGSAEVSVMSMRGRDWGWPDQKDQIWYEKERIIEVIPQPQLKPSAGKMITRQIYSVPEVLKFRKF